MSFTWGSNGTKIHCGGSVMLWTVFCWETLVSAIHVDVNLTRNYKYLSEATCLQIAPSWQWCSLLGMASFSKEMHPATLHTLFRNCLKNMM